MDAVVRTGEQLVIADYQQWGGAIARYARIDARAVVVALLISGRAVGAINVWHEIRRIFRGRPSPAQPLRPAGGHRTGEYAALHRSPA